MKDEAFEAHCQKLEDYFKNAMYKYRYIIPHLNDVRGSAVDRTIEAETDFDFALRHFKKIVELVEKVGKEHGLTK